MSVVIRPIEDGELEQFLRTMGGPFAFDLPEEDEKREAMLERFGSVFETDRTRCAFEDGEMIGTLGAFSLAMTTPGGTVDCAGTTMVTMSAAHRRQGHLRRMMGAHLDESRERGDPIAALWASDSAIYGRFGYGLASVEIRREIDPAHVRFHRRAPDGDTVGFVSADEAADLLPDVYSRVLPTRPGMYARSEDWWRHRRLRDAPEARRGATAFRYAVSHDEHGTPSGYAQYRVKTDWDLHGEHEVRVSELLSTSPSAEAGLWRVVLGHDLAGTVRASTPPDGGLVDLLDGPRRATGKLVDALWVRLLDIPAAFAARRYSAEGSVTVAVHDPVDGSVASFRIESDGDTGTATATRDDPDIELDVEDLGAAYLGRARLRRLAAAGRLWGDSAALATLDRMLTWDPQPWCPEVF